MYKVIIPEWEAYYIKSNKTKSKYWLYRDRDKLPLKYKATLRSSPVIILGKAYCCDADQNRYVKNTKKAGKPNVWMLNGQDKTQIMK